MSTHRSTLAGNDSVLRSSRATAEGPAPTYLAFSSEGSGVARPYGQQAGGSVNPAHSGDAVVTSPAEPKGTQPKPPALSYQTEGVGPSELTLNSVSSRTGTQRQVNHPLAGQSFSSSEAAPAPLSEGSMRRRGEHDALQASPKTPETVFSAKRQPRPGGGEGASGRTGKQPPSQLQALRYRTASMSGGTPSLEMTAHRRSINTSDVVVFTTPQVTSVEVERDVVNAAAVRRESASPNGFVVGGSSAEAVLPAALRRYATSYSSVSESAEMQDGLGVQADTPVAGGTRSPSRGGNEAVNSSRLSRPVAPMAELSRSPPKKDAGVTTLGPTDLRDLQGCNNSGVHSTDSTSAGGPKVGGGGLFAPTMVPVDCPHLAPCVTSQDDGQGGVFEVFKAPRGSSMNPRRFTTERDSIDFTHTPSWRSPVHTEDQRYDRGLSSATSARFVMEADSNRSPRQDGLTPHVRTDTNASHLAEMVSPSAPRRVSSIPRPHDGTGRYRTSISGATPNLEELRVERRGTYTSVNTSARRISEREEFVNDDDGDDDDSVVEVSVPKRQQGSPRYDPGVNDSVTQNSVRLSQAAIPRSSPSITSANFGRAQIHVFGMRGADVRRNGNDSSVSTDGNGFRRAQAGDATSLAYATPPQIPLASESIAMSPTAQHASVPKLFSSDQITLPMAKAATGSYASRQFTPRRASVSGSTSSTSDLVRKPIRGNLRANILGTEVPETEEEEAEQRRLLTERIVKAQTKSKNPNRSSADTSTMGAAQRAQVRAAKARRELFGSQDSGVGRQSGSSDLEGSGRASSKKVTFDRTVAVFQYHELHGKEAAPASDSARRDGDDRDFKVERIERTTAALKDSPRVSTLARRGDGRPVLGKAPSGRIGWEDATRAVLRSPPPPASVANIAEALSSGDTWPLPVPASALGGSGDGGGVMALPVVGEGDVAMTSLDGTPTSRDAHPQQKRPTAAPLESTSLATPVRQSRDGDDDVTVAAASVSPARHSDSTHRAAQESDQLFAPGGQATRGSQGPLSSTAGAPYIPAPRTSEEDTVMVSLVPLEWTQLLSVGEGISNVVTETPVTSAPADFTLFSDRFISGALMRQSPSPATVAAAASTSSGSTALDKGTTIAAVHTSPITRSRTVTPTSTDPSGGASVSRERRTDKAHPSVIPTVEESYVKFTVTVRPPPKPQPTPVGTGVPSNSHSSAAASAAKPRALSYAGSGSHLVKHTKNSTTTGSFTAQSSMASIHISRPTAVNAPSQPPTTPQMTSGAALRSGQSVWGSTSRVSGSPPPEMMHSMPASHPRAGRSSRSSQAPHEASGDGSSARSSRRPSQQQQQQQDHRPTTPLPPLVTAGKPASGSRTLLADKSKTSRAGSSNSSSSLSSISWTPHSSHRALGASVRGDVQVGTVPTGAASSAVNGGSGPMPQREDSRIARERAGSNEGVLHGFEALPHIQGRRRK